jgi:hypothetical protein
LIWGDVKNRAPAFDRVRAAKPPKIEGMPWLLGRQIFSCTGFGHVHGACTAAKVVQRHPLVSAQQNTLAIRGRFRYHNGSPKGGHS